MDITITPGRLKGPVTPPPSKSQAHRLILAAALAAGESLLSHVEMSQDIAATLSCMEQLGARWEALEGNRLRITGIGGAASPLRQSDGLPHFDCGESGSTLRFLIPIALAVAGGGVFAGRGRLMERPQGPYFALFDQRGILHEQKEGLLTLRGTLRPGDFSLPGDVSSQFVTGLLYALPFLEGDSRIRLTTPLESRGYVDMSLAVLRDRGVQIEETADGFALPGGQACACGDAAVESDWSQAGLYYAANGIGNRVEIRGMDRNSRQGDRIVHQWRELLDGPGEVELDVSGSPDLVPPLSVWAALRAGRTTRLVNASRLRIKESDRLATVTQELRGLGADITEGPDFLEIRGVETLYGGETDSHNDHRIAMMLAIAATRATGPVLLRGANSVRKSYPGFWEDYRSLGGNAT